MNLPEPKSDATLSRAASDPDRAASSTASMMSFPTQASGAGRSAATVVSPAMASVPRRSASQTSRKVPGNWANTSTAARSLLRASGALAGEDFLGWAGGTGAA